MSLKAIKPWIVSFRLRTLPLSASCIIMGSFIAAYSKKYDSIVFALALITTLLLQILSNISNEYGDMVKGTDSSGRIGPERSIQKGEITLAAMKRMMLILASIISVTGLSLVIYATASFYILIFIIAGAAAIVAAVKYTVGEKPYGYRALGDLFVFIFFGPVGVAGTFFLHTGLLTPDILLPASTTGLLSVAVLNLNNMRDADNDKEHGKITMALLLGKRRSRIYHLFLILIAFTASITYAISISLQSFKFIYLISFTPLIPDIIKVMRYSAPEELDSELKITSLSNLFHSILLGIALLI